MADVDGLVGAACSTVCQPVGLLAASWNIPMVSYFCGSESLADKETYPTFTRTSPNMVAVLPGAIAATIDAFGSVVHCTLCTPRSFFLNYLKSTGLETWCSVLWYMIHITIIYLHLYSAHDISGGVMACSLCIWRWLWHRTISQNV